MAVVEDSPTASLQTTGQTTPHSPRLEQNVQPKSDREASPDTEPRLLLQEDPFGNENSRILFDAIDQLRSCGAGQDLPLPEVSINLHANLRASYNTADITQLVIVGKQSAGKSALLESLTGIPFPVGSGLCTRFATRIMSRRTSPGTPDLVQVTMERGEIPPFDKSEQDFKPGPFYGPITTLTAEEFKKIMEKARTLNTSHTFGCNTNIMQAAEKMGISTNSEGVQKNFSSLVLRIELSGPRRAHFGILDIPGTFSLVTRTVTQQDLDGVTEMVTSYMKMPQNIIMFVISKNLSALY